MTNYAREALLGRLARAARRDPEEVESAFEYLIPESFMDPDGEIDDEKVQAFAEVWGPGSRPAVVDGLFDPVLAALNSARLPHFISSPTYEIEEGNE